MAETKQGRGKVTIGSNADSTVETAVRRLTEAGMSREHALKRIDATLYECLGKLNAAGIGGLSFLRQANLSAGMKLNALRVEAANEEDARDGI